MTADDVIYTLGIPGQMKGHSALVAGIKLIMEHPELRYEATKLLYPSIAQQVGGTAESVERNIRTAIQRCWRKGNRRFLNQIARYELSERPGPVELMDFAAAYVKWSNDRKNAHV